MKKLKVIICPAERECGKLLKLCKDRFRKEE